MQEFRVTVEARVVEPPNTDGKKGQHDQGSRHGEGGFVGVVMRMLVPGFPQEDYKEKPEHVKSREESREHAGIVKKHVARNGPSMDGVQNGVLGPETGQGINPRNRKR